MEICVQSGGVIEHFDAATSYEMISKAGFTAIDWNALEYPIPGAKIVKQDFEDCLYGKSDEEIYAFFADEVAQIKKHGLTISQAHAPFPAYVPGHPEVLEYMIGVYQKLIRLCDRVGCKNLIIHGISLALTDRENTPESIKALNMHLYESLIPVLLECNVTVCLENLFTWNGRAISGVCADASEAVWYVDTLNQKAGREVFGFCLDTGHLVLLGKDFRNYVPVLGSRIKALHIHDNDGKEDQHMAPMTGKTNWNDFCATLHDVGYVGDLSFETFAQADSAFKFDARMMMPWLGLIYTTGACMRDRILA